jgi:hypothetical protein
VADDRRFSVSAILITAIASFLISGVGGTILQRKISEARPLLVVSSAGFEGGPEVIELDRNLISLTQEDSWGPSFSHFETFEALRARDRLSAETEERLRTCIASTEAWLKDNRAGDPQLSESSLLKYPYLSDSTFGSSIHGSIRRREFSQAPVKDLKPFKRVFPVFSHDGSPMVHTGKKAVLFLTEGFIDSSMFAANSEVAESVSKGVRVNLVHYADEFLRDEQKALNTLLELRKAIQATLLQRARPAVILTIHNAGGAAIAFRPYFGLAVLGTDDEVADRYLLVADNPDGKNVRSTDGSELADIASLISGKHDGGGEEVKVEPYLPMMGKLSYTTVPPGETKELRLVATTDLGPKGTQYRASYESGLLKTEVVGLSISGKDYWSGVSVFGKQVNASDEKTVLGTIR